MALTREWLQWLARYFPELRAHAVLCPRHSPGVGTPTTHEEAMTIVTQWMAVMAIVFGQWIETWQSAIHGGFRRVVRVASAQTTLYHEGHESGSIGWR